MQATIHSQEAHVSQKGAINVTAAHRRSSHALALVLGSSSPFPGVSPRAAQVVIPAGRRGAIAEALAEAEENCTLVLTPGLYVEDRQLVLPAGVSIVCHEPFDRSQSVKRAHDSETKEARISISCEVLGNVPFISIRERGGQLKNIVLEVTENEKRDHRQFPCVDISGDSNVEILNCGIVCETRSGVRIKGAATPKIDGSILACSKEGILIQGKAAPTVTKSFVAVKEVAIRAGQSTQGHCEGNTLEASRDACIVGEGMSKTRFVANTLSIDTASKYGCAVVVRNSSNVTLERNRIMGSHYNGMQIGDCSNPVVKENVIVGSRASGIVMHEFATGIFVRNRIERSKLAGIGIRDNAEPYLRGNVVCDGEASGVVIMGEGKCVFEENKIRNNVGSGVRITAKSSDILFEGNELSGNRACGFWLDGECASTLQNNVVLRSERAGIYVTQKAAPRVMHNTVSEGDTAGILLDDDAAGHFSDNVIAKNAACNVMLGGRSRGHFESNLMSGSPSGGVLCFSESRCSLRKNRIEDNAIANVAVLDSSQPAVKRNSIKNGAGRGVVCGGTSQGRFVQNSITGNCHEGVYIGGHAKPVLERNCVEENGSSGMVIEDWAEGLFSDNAFRNNDSAAVAVQGNASPTLERTQIKHSGNGGVWLSERAGGTIRDTTMDNEHFEGSWRRGVRVTTKILSSPEHARSSSSSSRSSSRSASSASTGSLPPIARAASLGSAGLARKIAVIFNPGSDVRHAIAALSPPNSRPSTPPETPLPEVELPSSAAQA